MLSTRTARVCPTWLGLVLSGLLFVGASLHAQEQVPRLVVSSISGAERLFERLGAEIEEVVPEGGGVRVRFHGTLVDCVPKSALSAEAEAAGKGTPQPALLEKLVGPKPLVLAVPSLSKFERVLRSVVGKKPTPLEAGAGTRHRRFRMTSSLFEGGILFKEHGETAAPALPRSEDFARHLKAVMASYPADGTHRYHWPKRGGWKGNIHDLVYGGEVLAEGDAKGRAYCCGLTFEVFLIAWQAWAREQGRSERVLNLDRTGIKRLHAQWFGSSKDPSCLRTAIVKNGIGFELARKDWKRAQPGDFVQLWRHSGSGHSVVFLGWERAGSKISGLRYWSTQKSTRGIGERVERFGDSGSALDAERFWIARVGAKAPRSR